MPGSWVNTKARARSKSAHARTRANGGALYLCPHSMCCRCPGPCVPCLHGDAKRTARASFCLHDDVKRTARASRCSPCVRCVSLVAAPVLFMSFFVHPGANVSGFGRPRVPTLSMCVRNVAAPPPPRANFVYVRPERGPRVPTLSMCVRNWPAMPWAVPAMPGRWPATSDFVTARYTNLRNHAEVFEKASWDWNDRAREKMLHN